MSNYNKYSRILNNHNVIFNRRKNTPLIPLKTNEVYVPYKCHYCGETDKKKMYCYDRNKELYSHRLCWDCHQIYNKHKIKVKITYANGEPWLIDKIT